MNKPDAQPEMPKKFEQLQAHAVELARLIAEKSDSWFSTIFKSGSIYFHENPTTGEQEFLLNNPDNWIMAALASITLDSDWNISGALGEDVFDFPVTLLENDSQFQQKSKQIELALSALNKLRDVYDSGLEGSTQNQVAAILQ